MTTRNKSFLEDTLILFVIGILIYAIYSFIFPSNDNEQIEEVKTTIEEKIENPLLNETIDSKIKNDENIFEEEKEENILNEEVQTTLKDEEIKIDSTKTKIEEKVEEKIEEKTSVKKDDLESFYENIRGSINKNIEKTPAKDNESINIRVTILKDGRYEQLILLEGNKEYFNKVRSSITKVFPVKIDDSIKSNFPRYFRMEIGNK